MIYLHAGNGKKPEERQGRPRNQSINIAAVLGFRKYKKRDLNNFAMSGTSVYHKR